MIDPITFLGNNRKSDIYTGVTINGFYRYLKTIGSTTTLTTSVQRSHSFVPSYSNNNYTETLQSIIAALCFRQDNICKLCGIIGHKAGACIIHGPNFLPPSIRINMNKFSDLCSNKITDPPR